MAAQATPSVSRAYVAPGPDGIAHGTPADEDIFATGSGQTLNGGGGNDIFHIGTFTDAVIVVPGSGGITEVATWVGGYTLPAGVDNLSGNGDGAHALTGNARDNFIVGAGGNDTLDGGLGNDVLIGSGGRDTFIETAGNGSDTVHFVVGTGGDVMQLANYGYSSFDDVRAHMTALTGGGTLLTHANGETTLFLNDGAESIRDVTPNNFTADNFILAGATTPPTGGTHTLTVHLAEDAFNGDAMFTLDVDGAQIAGPTAVSVKHGSGFQDFTYTGDFGTSPHAINVHFINDAWGGTPDTDRNLYVGGVDYDFFHEDGQTAQNNATNGQPDADPTAAEMYINGTVSFLDVTQQGNPGHPPSNVVPLTLHMSEDAFNGNAQFSVDLDGTIIFGPSEVSVLHGSGAQDFTRDVFLSAGQHTVAVHFLNDAWGGTPETDRNLYVQSMDVNGVHFAGNTASNDAANGGAAADPSAAVMMINGTASFTFDQSQILS